MPYEISGLLIEKIKFLEKPLVLFLCGMPGMRKSSTAIELANALKVKVVAGTDQIRDLIRKYRPNSFLEKPSHQCWTLLGKRTHKNIIGGYLKQCFLVKNGVLELLELAKNRGEDMIFEGVHLAPVLFLDLQKEAGLKFFHFLLYIENNNFKLHENNIGDKIQRRHGKEKMWPREKLENIRTIQGFLLKEKLPRVHLISSLDPKSNTQKILSILWEELCKKNK